MALNITSSAPIIVSEDLCLLNFHGDVNVGLTVTITTECGGYAHTIQNLSECWMGFQFVVRNDKDRDIDTEDLCVILAPGQVKNFTFDGESIYQANIFVTDVPGEFGKIQCLSGMTNISNGETKAFFDWTMVGNHECCPTFRRFFDGPYPPDLPVPPQGPLPPTPPNPACSATTDITFDVATFSTTCKEDTTQQGNIIFLNVTGGTPPYQYSIDGGQTYFIVDPPEFYNLDFGTYTFCVQDISGCTGCTVFEVEEAPFVDPSFYLAPTVGLSGRTGPAGSTNPNNNQDTFKCLGNGDYRVRTTNADPTFFYFSEAYGSQLVTGETYCIRINLGNMSQKHMELWFDGADTWDIPGDEPTGCSGSCTQHGSDITMGGTIETDPFVYTGQDIKLWFFKDTPGSGVAQFTMTSFKVVPK